MSGKKSTHLIIADEILDGFIITVSQTGQAELSYVEDRESNPDAKVKKNKRFCGAYPSVAHCLKTIVFNKLCSKYKVVTLDVFFNEMKKVDKEIKEMLFRVMPESESMFENAQKIELLQRKIVSQNAKIKELTEAVEKVYSMRKEFEILRNNFNVHVSTTK